MTAANNRPATRKLIDKCEALGWLVEAHIGSTDGTHVSSPRRRQSEGPMGAEAWLSKHPPVH